MVSKREILWAVLWLLLATAASFSRLVEHPADILAGRHNNGLNDVTTHVLSVRPLFPTSWEQTGQFPLWNPWAMAGVPAFGNPQLGILYPPNWLYFGLPATVCANWLVFFHHFWAGLGTYLLARSIGLNCWSSLGSAMFFLAAPYMMAQTCEGHVSQVCLMSWTPWLWLAYERIRAGQSGGLAAAALVLSLAFFCDHVQELFYLVLMFSAFSLWDACRNSSGLPQGNGWRIPLIWGCSGLLAIGIVAIELMPIAAYHRQAARAAGVTVAQASHGSPCLQSFWQLLDPLAFGGPVNSLDPKSMWWGSYWESLLSFGVGPLLLALWAVLSARGIYPRGRLICVALITILFSLGDDTPLFPLLHRWLPGISLFRAPMRALFHASFAVSLLAGIGLEQTWRLAQSSESVARSRAQLFWRVLAVFAAIGLLLACRNEWPLKMASGDTWPQIHWVSVLGYLLTVSLSLCLLWSLPQFSRLWMTICLLGCGFEFAAHARAITRTIPLASWRQSNAILDRVTQDLGDGRLLAPQCLVSDREAWQRRVSKIEAYEPVPIALWGEFLAAVCPGIDPSQTLTGFQPPKLSSYRKPLLDLVGVKYAAIIGHAATAPPGWEIVVQGSIPEESVLRGGRQRLIKYTLLRNQTPLPQAWLTDQIQPVASLHDAFGALKTLDAHRQILVEGSPQNGPVSNPQKFDEVELRHVSPQTLTASVDLKQDGMFVLSVMRNSGWRATVDGMPTPIYPTNFAFQGLALAAGKHEVEFRFTPPGMRLGAIISGLAAFLWMLALIKAIRIPVITTACSP
jgi:hypothetical protein